MAKPNRICHTCGTSYYYCPSCSDDKRSPQIYTLWCGEHCKKIFNTLSDETFKKLTTSECKNELIKLGVTLNDNFRDGVRTHVERVLSYVVPIEENEETDENEMSNKENVTTVNKTVTHSKTKKKKNSEVN